MNKGDIVKIKDEYYLTGYTKSVATGDKVFSASDYENKFIFKSYGSEYLKLYCYIVNVNKNKPNTIITDINYIEPFIENLNDPVIETKQHKCTCDMQSVMRNGCQCGGI